MDRVLLFSADMFQLEMHLGGYVSDISRPKLEVGSSRTKLIKLIESVVSKSAPIRFGSIRESRMDATCIIIRTAFEHLMPSDKV